MSVTEQQLQGTGTLAPGVWSIDGAHSLIGAVARHMMITKVRGRFDRFSGQVTVADKPEDSIAELAIEAASINTGSEPRDEHLRSADFLDVENHPNLTFRSTGIERHDDRRFTLRGDLSIRGVTRPIELEATFEGVTKSAFGEGQVAFFTAIGEFDREEFGMTWNHGLETGGVLVSKKLQLEIEAQLTK
ncbi:MAG TPA: YceI family protein [Actinomycetota bacterium]|nr:YceI family protein [Actinomycetota bacterium]